MADGLSMSMGGRVASIYKQNTKRRRFTTVVNDIENKKLNFLKKQLESDRVVETNRMKKINNKVLNASDELKAFQVALLRRITAVNEVGVFEDRPLRNLGRYGGASIEQIKAESLKYKRIRDPEKRRKIKSKILMEQGKRDGRIKSFNPGDLGDLTESILKLTKAEMAQRKEHVASDVGNLDDVREADDDENEVISPPNPPQRRLVLPPLQVSKPFKPNENYYRKISADVRKRMAGHTNQHRVLEKIREEGKYPRPTPGVSPQLRHTDYPITSLRHYPNDHRQYSEASYEWDHRKAVGPVKMSKHLNDGQKFWNQTDSLLRHKHPRRVVLPRIV
uniref:uncharacterized protein LOC104266792 isoform X1 n=1 Tax=Ciona intestinalis TaxID=7719 RepID=UPI00089DC335|nr:uncharacterized protein LOC104266792 isoform X1 [Ciona intestinalis]XP_026693872.1 uncharacterized protein LOC104266792 isoform X1 [Ciona intestinalis]XP_026693873.1 uncharacterized protein LOC104266792 isoform X1 [Ciona intestinalis]XP_026693882.1 uncharacterized protein LOC104266792 isoform X1 [Ciona intestinalis]|eukprot:XP_018666744.1 uncharacterized protein LOC104266792 isoform X1 [Ciona intestinalis]